MDTRIKPVSEEAAAFFQTSSRRCWSSACSVVNICAASVCVPAPRGLQPSVRPAAGVCGRAGRVSVSLQSAGESRNHRAEES